MPEANLCRHCFSVLEDGETECSSCGKKQEANNPEESLPLGTQLGGRYRIGMVLHHNDLLTTYLQSQDRGILPRDPQTGRG